MKLGDDNIIWKQYYLCQKQSELFNRGDKFISPNCHYSFYVQKCFVDALLSLSTDLIGCLQKETIVSLLQQLELFDGGN